MTQKAIEHTMEDVHIQAGLFEEINHHNMQHNPAFLGDITII